MVNWAFFRRLRLRRLLLLLYAIIFVSSFSSTIEHPTTKPISYQEGANRLQAWQQEQNLAAAAAAAQWILSGTGWWNTSSEQLGHSGPHLWQDHLHGTFHNQT